MDDPHVQQLSELHIAVAKHEFRLDAMEKLIAAQTAAVQSLQSRLTTIGSIMIGVLGAGSEQGGELIRLLFGG
jgi:hypothetical protein